MLVLIALTLIQGHRVTRTLIELVHSTVKQHKIAMIVYVREITAKKARTYGKYGSF